MALSAIKVAKIARCVFCTPSESLVFVNLPLALHCQWIFDAFFHAHVSCVQVCSALRHLTHHPRVRGRLCG